MVVGFVQTQYRPSGGEAEGANLELRHLLARVQGLGGDGAYSGIHA